MDVQSSITPGTHRPPEAAAAREISATPDTLSLQVKALSRLHDLAMRLASTSEPQPALQAILETLVDVHGADFGLLSLYDARTGFLTPAASVGFSEPILHELAKLKPSRDVGACGSAFFSGRRLIVEDVSVDPCFAQFRHIAEAVGFRSTHSTPILTQTGAALGVLSVHFRLRRVPTECEVQLADLCARHAADAMEAAKNRRALREREERLRLATAIDITDRKRAEESLRESEQRFRNMADHAPVMIWVTEADGRCTFLGKTWYKFTGRTPEDSLDFGWIDAVHPDDRDAARETFLASNARQEAFQIEYRLRAKSGNYHWVIDAAVPRFADDDQFLGYIGSVIDISNRKQAEEALRTSEQIYRAIGESNDFGVWICDPEGNNVYASESFLNLVGMTQEQCSKLGWGDVLHPDEAQATIAAWKECVRSGAKWDREHLFRGVDGEWHAVLARGVPVRNQRGEITAWAGINLDISQLKKVETELREADRRKDEFLAVLAHELRNPLAPIRTGLELMRLAADDPVAIEEIRATMDRQSQQMVRLIDDLLDVSRITRGTFELRKSRVEVGAVIGSAVETARPVIEELNHQLDLDIPRQPIVLEADPTRLAQIIANLLNNAAKYMPRGGRIRLRVERQDGMAVVSVKDAGIGIPADMIDRIFDMFTQVDGSLERSQGGLGIGLTLVKRLAEMHGGSVEAHSAGPDQGSEFIVRLPIVTGLLSDASESNGQALKSSGRRRVVVVDDNEHAAQVLGMLLKALGNEVRTAHDGRTAIELAEQFAPDIMLMDIGMPKLNGYETARRIRAQPWGRCIVLAALTG